MELGESRPFIALIALAVILLVVGALILQLAIAPQGQVFVK
jgi:hypothetical protein